MGWAVLHECVIHVEVHVDVHGEVITEHGRCGLSCMWRGPMLFNHFLLYSNHSVSKSDGVWTMFCSRVPLRTTISMTI